MDGYISEVRFFAANFAPRGWALCDGQLLAISSNQALFSLIGTQYGGDGRTTFALPDLRGRSIVHAGSGPGLTNRSIGQKGGTETNTLGVQQLPAHNHPASAVTNAVMQAESGAGTETTAVGNMLANSTEQNFAPPNAFPNQTMAQESVTATTDVTVGNAGANQAVNNMAPFEVVNAIICLQGIYPSRS